MPVFNAGPYLGEAIESILKQTLIEFELFIIDDCSVDDSLAIARQYEAQDERITVLVNDHNRGRAYSDNRGHALARGLYIAKMDADDVALPHRLQAQFDFLESHPAVSLTSSFLETFGYTRTRYKYPVIPDEVRGFLLFNMPVGNPTVFFRRELITEYNLHYDEQIKDTFGEDYEWVARVAYVAVIENQPEILLRYRTFSSAHKADVHALRTAKANLIRERILERAGFQVSVRELHVHNTIAHYPFSLGDISLVEVHTWLLNLASQNKYLRFVDPNAMRRVLAERWFWTCYHNPDRTLDNYREFKQRGLARDYEPAVMLKFKMWLKSKILRHLRN